MLGTDARQERNVAVVRRFLDGALNGGDLDVIDQIWSEDHLEPRRSGTGSTNHIETTSQLQRVSSD